MNFSSSDYFKETVIGRLPNDWNYSTLRDLGGQRAVQTGPFGSLLHSSDYSEDGTGVPLLLVNSFKNGNLTGKELPKVNKNKADTLSRFLLKEGDIVFSRVGEVGRTIYINKNMEGWLFSGQTLRIRLENKKINNRFVELYFRSKEAKKVSDATSLGTTRPSINTEILLNRVIPIPPIYEQNEIVRIVNSLDSKISLIKQLNVSLESIVQALFKSWFVDFDPVRAKMVGEPPESICKRLKLMPEILNMFPDRLVNSELGEIPDGWKLKKLSDFIDLERGLSYKGKYLSDTGTPMVNLGCISKDSTFIETSIKYYTGDFKIKYQVSSGDIVIANTDITQKREVLGSPVFVPEIFENHIFIFTHHLYAVRFKNEISKHYIFQLLCTKRYRNRVIGFATGTTVLAIPEETILSFKFAEPTFKILSLFHILIDSIYERIKVSEKENNFLEETRDLLLPQLMSGKIRVPVGDANE